MNIEMIFPAIIAAAKGLLITVVPGVIRSVYGWFEKANEDNKFSEFEIQELKKTVLRTTFYGIMTYSGLNIAEIENAEIASIIATIIVDKLMLTIKNLKK